MDAQGGNIALHTNATLYVISSMYNQPQRQERAQSRVAGDELANEAEKGNQSFSLAGGLVFASVTIWPR